MTPHALPTARNRQPLAVPGFNDPRFNAPRFGTHGFNALGFLGMAALLLCLPWLTACQGVSTGATQTSTAPQISGTLAAASVGVPYTGTLTATGGKPPYTFDIATGALPTGLTLSQTAGTISGTPSQTGAFSFTAQVTDSNNLSGSQFFQINVTTPGVVVVTVSPATATITSPGTMQFSALITDSSSGAVTWSASPGTISSSGLYQSPTVTSSTTATVTATSVATPTISGTASLTIMPGQQGSVAITTSSLPGATAGTAYSATLQATGGTTPYAWTLASGTLPTGLSLQSSGLLSGTTTQTGQFNLTVGVADSSSPQQTASQSLVLVVSSLGTSGLVTITTSSLPGATAGTAYSTTLQATGGTTPYTWTLASGTLPTGLTLQSSGLLSGTTVQTGQFNLTVSVADSSSPQLTSAQSFVLTVSSSGATGIAAPSTMWGFSTTNTGSNNYPTVTYTMQRFWDSPPLQWPSINTAAGVFDFTNLDSTLAQAYSSGVTDGLYTLARTPPWITSNPADTSCFYATATAGGGNGECDPPIDLNSDGSGTNATWKAWITAIATHVDDPTYLQTHAHIKYWEIWNEPDSQGFWLGTFAQLARLTEDANCIITGRGVIHQSGNGTATPCTATAIDTTAQIVMASAHANSPDTLAYGQNQLYCNNTSASPSYQLPCPNPPNAIASAVDIINYHMKPGDSQGDNCPIPTPCTPETAMQVYLSNIQGILQPAELAKPLWDGEASYSDSGFTGAYTDGDMAASYMPRFYLLNWSLGVSGIAWYTWDDLAAEPAEVVTAYQQTYNWMAQSTLVTPCAPNGTVWSCTIDKSGTLYLIMWDASQSCANGTCTTSNQTVGSQWSQYQDMTTASTPTAISGGTVAVGIKPVVFQ